MKLTKFAIVLCLISSFYIIQSAKSFLKSKAIDDDGCSSKCAYSELSGGDGRGGSSWCKRTVKLGCKGKAENVCTGKCVFFMGECMTWCKACCAYDQPKRKCVSEQSFKGEAREWGAKCGAAPAE